MADYSGADATVQATNDSSIVSKASAAALGYFEDAFVGLVAARGPKGRLIRRSPLVNRCYYVRHLGVLQMQEVFLQSCVKPGEAYNVVALGAGFDTGALRRPWPEELRYFEVDFPAVLARKEALLRRNQAPKPAWLRSCGADLRQTSEVEASLKEAGANFSNPTLLIAEVVLAYMERHEGDALISWVAKSFPNCLFGMYEQQGPHDPFGRFMRRHFAQRQCPLRSLLENPDLESQRQRFRAFQRVDAADMMSVLAAESGHELGRARSLEPFDEYEELHLKCVHYFCLAAMSGSCAKAHWVWKDDPKPALAGSLPVHVIPHVGISRFGLAACYVDGHLVVCGGHGTQDVTVSDTHGRQASVMVRKLDLTDQTSSDFKAVGEHSAAMYCTATAVGSRVFLFGGRLGPQRPSAGLSVCEVGMSFQQVPQSCPWPPPRWRHSATQLVLGTTTGIFVLGGTGATVISLDHAWFLNTDTLTWQCLQIESPGGTPAARHSHAAALGPDGVLVCGGLDACETMLADAWTLQVVSDAAGSFKLSWHQSPSPLPQPRYGHSLHYYSGSFLVVGGIESRMCPAPICAWGKPFEITDAGQEEEIFMWHNHASVMLDDEHMLVLGGGGNCFSFGTHLNRSAHWLQYEFLQLPELKSSPNDVMRLLRWAALCVVVSIQFRTCLHLLRHDDAREVATTESLNRRSSVATGASVQRQSRASRVQKSWILDEAQVDHLAAEDATQAGIQQQDALKIVKCTTRFATAMCVVIAFVKVSIYLATGAEVVRTSALDSLGDLMANMITLYTGYRMTNVDKKRYPVGQGKFQSIGCLVFSTLMFALMFGNALGNLESLVESKDDVGHAAVTRFFQQTEEVDDFKKWRDDLDCEEECVWKTDGDKIDNPLINYFKEKGDSGEKAMAEEMEPKMTRGEIVSFSSEYENAAEQWAELKKQNFFLGICASYKCCLWLYCIFYAIPKSGSCVLVALATDKRNDFICTSFVIFSTFFAATFPNITEMAVSEEKVDPLVSLMLSVFIMYTWSELMVEHMTLLSQEAANDEFRDGVLKEVRMVVKADSPCTVDDSDVIVYVSGLGHTVEVTLTAKSDKTTVGEMGELAQLLRRRLMTLEDVERAIVMKAMPSKMNA
ncbi:unnamed protein product [Effrenium voratum]|nr:unnamed protein product [Effrenium voratum]